MISATNNMFLSIARINSILDNCDRPGVYHRKALVAYQIIANTAFNDGYLTLYQASQQRVTTPLDGRHVVHPCSASQ